MPGLLSSLTFNLLILVIFAAVVLLGLRIAQSIFATSSKRAAATEIAAKLVSYPTGSAAVLRRRFVRALTSQHVVMPSGERLAFADLVVRVAPEDLERLDPDGDLERLGDDAAKLYAEHAERAGWAVPQNVTVTVEVDPGLRSGWVPPARGSGRADSSALPREARRLAVGWDVVSEAIPDPEATMGFPALVPDLAIDAAPTMNVASGLCLERDGRAFTVMTDVVLGRLPESAVPFDDPEVSFRHAAVRRQGTIWEVKDLGSTNGTMVDGHRIDDWTPLHPGAVLALAGVRITASPDHAGTVHLRGVTTH